MKPIRKRPILLTLALHVVLLAALPVRAQDAAISTNKTPAQVLLACLMKVADIIEPLPGHDPQLFTAQARVISLKGASKVLAGLEAEVACLAPDHLRITAKTEGNRYALGRDGQGLWFDGGKLALVGSADVPRFSTQPDRKDGTKMKGFKLPLQREELVLAQLFFKIETRPAETVGGVKCQVLRVTTQPGAAESMKIANLQLDFWIRETDSLPARIGYSDLKGFAVVVEFSGLRLGGERPPETWQLQAAAWTKVERVALSHLTRFLDASLEALTHKPPTLGPVTGERRVLATEGAGRLEDIDGTRMLFLKGTPEEMGRQQGVLLKPQIRNVVDRILYGVGVGSSFAKGSWFFGEIERAQQRLEPFMNPRYYREMDALASAAHIPREEIRLANFFPELFHCSGFALYGEATAGGRMFHGRILDYLKGAGLEQNAVVIVSQPEQGNAWVNVSYAGFVGSVTAMNEKHISIGEMGGRGEGDWDGKPMAQLVREVMEQANTLDEAIAILRRGPRTCEYYYVIADAKAKRAVGIAATSKKFEVIQPGHAHPELPTPVKDAVLMSAGNRYEELVRRVKAGLGKFDADSARDLMKAPVCMESNIHSALFEPETLDFWVANADGKNVASHTRFTHYNLAELLKGPPSPPFPKGGTEGSKR
jgi:hypothetical protein